MIHVVSTFYISKYSSNLDEIRSKELEESLLKNLSNEFIEKIHLFVDDEEALNTLRKITNNSEKVSVIAIGIKPKYNDFFNYILNNIKEKICMIINADIFLYELELELINKLNYEKKAYALTRYEYDMSHPLMDSYGGSHDCYLFNSKFLSEKIINEDTNFYQNYPGIESHIIKALCDDGFSVYNPCKQIKIVHLHKCGLRNHGEWIGLHRCGDTNYHRNSCWWVPPINM